MIPQEALRQRVETFEVNRDPFITTAIRNIAAAMVEQAAKVRPGQKVLIWFDEPGMQLARELHLRSIAKGAQTSFFMRDLEKDAEETPTLSDEEIIHRFDEEERLINSADVVLIIRGPANPQIIAQVPRQKKNVYDKRTMEVHGRRIRGEVNWCLMLWPTEYEAQKEGLPYNEYFRVYMEACNQPWEAIRQAQAHLKEKLDRGKHLTFIADEDNPDPRKRTWLTMSIEEMTFANSTIARNYPGSEVFSAPVLNSVDGQIFARGEYLYGGHLMRDIYLRVENGKIVEAHAEEGKEGLQQILNQGEGARYFGEVALGTNPGLRRRFFNDLLNEKVGGSFHMAIGHCYTNTEYDGEPVNLNNGNTEERTPIHWDLTILMHRRNDGTGGGKVIVDGEVIQEDGKFVDPKLALLNPKL